MYNFSRKTQTGTSHAGPHHHHDHRDHNPQVAYRCSGQVEEVSDNEFVLFVRQAHGRARRWMGQRVRFSLVGAQLLDQTGTQLEQLAPRDTVEVRTRLPRQLQDMAIVPAYRVRREAVPLRDDL